MRFPITVGSERFRRCLDLTLSLWEVGPTAAGDTVDTGGRTRWGISAQAYPGENIAGMTLDRAAELYERDYWQPLVLDDLDDWRVAAKVFDIAVNVGRAGAAKLAQRALAVVGRRVAVDGIVGPVTRAALDSVPAAQMLAALCCEQRAHYERLICRDPERYAGFAGGWARRAAWVPR